MRLGSRHLLVAVAAGSLLLMGSAIPLLRMGPLSGRTIVIDPGHGGPHDKGAVGPGGLQESFVNLQVGLRLADLLQRRGARVILTRTTDAPAIPDVPGDPAADLRARAEVANKAEADLFISVHHNDTTITNDPRNETQVYWKLEDPGPSQDFAKLLLPKLAESLSQPRQQLIPGNFAVLRHSRRPAILGEGAYLSNPVSEARLGRPETWQREAEAYATTVETYFERGVPRFGQLAWTGGTLQVPLTTDRQPIAEVDLRVDDLPVKATYDRVNAIVSWTPTAPLANGPHRVAVAARNQAGNAALPLEASITVTRPAAAITARAVPPVWRPDDCVSAFVSCDVKDSLGQAVADGTEVRFGLGDHEVAAVTRSGQASAFLPWSRSGPAPVTVAAGKTATKVAFAPIDTQNHLIVTLSGWGSDVPAASAYLDRQPCGLSDGDGRLAISTVPGSHELTIQAPGYQPWHWSYTGEAGGIMQVNARMEARYDGVFLGKRIVLDPLTSEQDPAVGKQSLYLARLLRDRLLVCGAQVNLTRPEGDNPEQADRVRMASRFGADLYLVVAPGGGQAAHYYTSANGSRLAKLVCAMIPGFHPAPEAGYLLSHTPCPALVVRAPLAKAGPVADGLFEALRRYFVPVAGNG